MNTRKLLLPLLGASALLLSGCFKTMEPAVLPQTSTTDPIAEAQYIQYNTSERANSQYINMGSGLEDDYAVDETPSHRKFSHRWLAGPGFKGLYSEPLHLDKQELASRFSEICTNLNGAFSDGGWCIDTATRNHPLFWAMTDQEPIQPGRNWTSIYVLAPPRGKDHTDPLWLSFAKGQGFLGRDDRRRQAQTLLKEGMGVMVCRTVSYGMTPLYKDQDKGYIEGIANKRIKIRIFQSVRDRTTYGGAKGRKDVNNETIWDRPENWYICD